MYAQFTEEHKRLLHAIELMIISYKNHIFPLLINKIIII